MHKEVVESLEQKDGERAASACLSKPDSLGSVLGADGEGELSSDLIGQTVGDKYRVLSLIGKGRISVVYKAQEMATARVVALKVINCTSENVNADALRLFETNARLSIQHPNLLTVYACGLLANGQPWLACEYFQCYTLAELLEKEGYLTVETASKLWEPILNAIAHLHGKGEVHMNVKPSNVLIADTDGGRPFVKIADFGIAKLLLERELQTIGEEEIPEGSPLFMSPEQFKGERIDARSDVYSLGCMFYQMLIGRSPQQGVNLLQTMDRHINTAVEFPSEPEVHELIQSAVSRMLSKDPAERQRSATEAKSDLEQAIAGQPPKPRPQSVQISGISGSSAAYDQALVSGWKKKKGKKGREPWPLLLGCVTVLLFIVIIQQCLALVRQVNDHDVLFLKHSPALSGGDQTPPLAGTDSAQQ